MFPSEVVFIGENYNKPSSEIKVMGNENKEQKMPFRGFQSPSLCSLTFRDYEPTVKDASLCRALKSPENFQPLIKPSICKGKKCAFI